VVQLVQAEYGVNFLCELLQLQKSSFYYTSKAGDDSHLRDAIEEICLKQTRYGYRRVTDRLHRAGISVDKEKVRSLMREMGLSVRPLRRKIQTTQSKKGKPLYPNLIKNLEIARHIFWVWFIIMSVLTRRWGI